RHPSSTLFPYTTLFRSTVGVETSRYSAEYGKGSGGVLDLNTGIGDDHFRFAATDFIPSLQNKKGITLDKFNPRLTLSGPIQKGKDRKSTRLNSSHVKIS